MPASTTGAQVLYAQGSVIGFLTATADSFCTCPFVATVQDVNRVGTVTVEKCAYFVD